MAVCKRFLPVFRHFFMEKFRDPAAWFEARLAYTKSVATNSIGLYFKMNYVYNIQLLKRFIVIDGLNTVWNLYMHTLVNSLQWPQSLLN